MSNRRAAGAAAAVVAAVAVAACGSSTPKVSAATLLQKAKSTLDAASAVHFKLTSSNVSLSSTNLTGGEGDIVRPDSLRGNFTVAINGFTADVKVVSVNGVFAAQLPFATHYQRTNPANFGLTDPAQLLSPHNGLTSLLTSAPNPRTGPSKRVDGELLDTVTYTVPGRSVPVLPNANPASPVTVTASIDPSNYQLRTVTLTGPLTTAQHDSTFVVTLTNYNEHVTVTLPPTS